jgi:hypothetical protein
VAALGLAWNNLKNGVRRLVKTVSNILMIQKHSIQQD